MIYEFNNCVISVCSRTCNQVAGCLAAYGVCMGDDDVSLFDHAPEFVFHLVSAKCLETMFNGSQWFPR